METKERLQVLVIGAGQAGLAISYFLKKEKVKHLVLEKGQVGNSWYNQRWDSFQLVTPNWQIKLPGFQYEGNQADGFFSKREVIHYLERYWTKFDLPVNVNTEVYKVLQIAGGAFEVASSKGTFVSDSVVVATGSFSQPWFPEAARSLPRGIHQLHSSQYRHADMLPEGSILVVGAGQSGFQIASELNRAGRRVFLSMGHNTWIPRTYRGVDIAKWLTDLGVADLPFSQSKGEIGGHFAKSPVICDSEGGFRGLNHDGVVLLGHFDTCLGSRLLFKKDLQSLLAESDWFYIQVTRLIDQYIQKQRIPAPPRKGRMAELLISMQVPSIFQLELKNENINTVIWATGFKSDYSWVHVPISDEKGFLKYNRGITQVPGFYFLGLHLLYNLKSGSLFGVGEDAQFLICDMKRRFGFPNLRESRNRMSG